MITGIKNAETHPTYPRFSPTAVLLFVLILCLCLSLLTAYGLDIVVPLSFILGTCLGILVTRRYRRSDLLGGSLGGALGCALGGIVIEYFAPAVGVSLLGLMIGVFLLLPGLGGGFILALVVIVASRSWRKCIPSRHWILTTVAILAIIAGIVLIPWPYREQAYSGDGTIEDTGFWSYPRYHVKFARISLTEPGKYVFRCSGLPPHPLTFTLPIDGKGNYDLLSGLTTVVDVQLSAADGQTVHQASGPLHEWVLAGTPAYETGKFWHLRLRDVKVKRNRKYTLTILVKDVDSDSPPLQVQPTLSGGGNELP